MSNVSTVGKTTDVSLSTTETAVVTSVAKDVNNPRGQGIRINGVVNVSTDATSTNPTLRVRRGSGTGGTLVGEGQLHTLAASSSANIGYDVLDSLTDVEDQEYTLTVELATGTGTANNATIGVEACTRF